MPTPRLLSALRFYRHHRYQSSYSYSLSTALDKFDFDAFHTCSSETRQETKPHLDTYNRFQCNPYSQFIRGQGNSPSSLALRNIYSVNSSRNVVSCSISRNSSHLFFSRGEYFFHTNFGARYLLLYSAVAQTDRVSLCVLWNCSLQVWLPELRR